MPKKSLSYYEYDTAVKVICTMEKLYQEYKLNPPLLTVKFNVSIQYIWNDIFIHNLVINRMLHFF